jgi:hypothetical protein
MRSRRWTVLLSVLLVGLLMLSACAPRTTAGEVAAGAAESEIAVDLPALVLDIQEDGSFAVGGQSLADLGAVVGQDLSALSVPADTVGALVANNIQHIQIENTPSGILILVNGKAIPSLAWDGESLVTTAEVLEQFGAAPIALLDKILPLIRNLGLGVIVRAPVAAGAEQLPLVSTDVAAAERAMSAQQEFLQAVLVPPTFLVTVTYAPDGSWEVAGIGQAELDRLIPGFGNALNLGPDGIQQLSAIGIEQIGISTNENGFFISINGKTLPYLTWADGRINNVLDLAVQSGLLEGVVPGMDTGALLQYVDALLPAILASQISLNVEFP